MQRQTFLFCSARQSTEQSTCKVLKGVHHQQQSDCTQSTRTLMEEVFWIIKLNFCERDLPLVSATYCSERSWGHHQQSGCWVISPRQTSLLNAAESVFFQAVRTLWTAVPVTGGTVGWWLDCMDVRMRSFTWSTFTTSCQITWQW